jgi:hypothetical protein
VYNRRISADKGYLCVGIRLFYACGDGYDPVSRCREAVVDRSLALFGRRGIFSGPFLEKDESGGHADGGGEAGPITFKNQDDLDKLIQRRLDRDREARKKEIRDELRSELKDEIKNEETQEELAEQGKFKDLYDKEVKKVEKLEQDIKDLKQAAADRELSDLRKQVAAKHKLPDELADRLVGENEEELTADAKTLAKKLNLQEGEGKPAGPDTRRKPVDTDTGKGSSSLRPPEKAGGGGQSQDKRQYAFTKEGDVSWG